MQARKVNGNVSRAQCLEHIFVCMFSEFASPTQRREYLWKRLGKNPTRRENRLLTTGSLVEVDVDALELEVGVTVVGTGGVNTVLVADNLPGSRKKDGGGSCSKSARMPCFYGDIFCCYGMDYMSSLYNRRQYVGLSSFGGVLGDPACEVVFSPGCWGSARTTQHSR